MRYKQQILLIAHTQPPFYLLYTINFSASLTCTLSSFLQILQGTASCLVLIQTH